MLLMLHESPHDFLFNHLFKEVASPPPHPLATDLLRYAFTGEFCSKARHHFYLHGTLHAFYCKCEDALVMCTVPHLILSVFAFLVSFF